MRVQKLDTLIKQLRSGTSERREQAVEAAQSLASGGNQERRAFVDAGGIEALVSMLRSVTSSAEAKQQAVACLQRLSQAAASEPDERQRMSHALVAAGAARPLVQLAQRASDSRNQQLLGDALTVMHAICAAGGSGTAAVADAGATPLLLALLDPRQAIGMQALTALLLVLMSGGQASVLSEISLPSSAERLVAALRTTLGRAAGDSPHQQVQDYTAICLNYISQQAQGSAAAAGAGGVPALVQCLAEGSVVARASAGQALLHVAAHDPSQVPAMAAAGAVPAALSTLRCRRPPEGGISEVTPAALLICRVCMDLPERHAEVRGAGGVETLRHLLQSSENEKERRAADLALRTLEAGRYAGMQPFSSPN